MKNFIVKVERKCAPILAAFAVAFINISMEGICFYIFHQVKFPVELRKYND